MSHIVESRFLSVVLNWYKISDKINVRDLKTGRRAVSYRRVTNAIDLGFKMLADNDINPCDLNYYIGVIKDGLTDFNN